MVALFERFSAMRWHSMRPDASIVSKWRHPYTFSPAGYTAWDPSSPSLYIARTLCIPTVFVSYTARPLDYKVPLLKALMCLISRIDCAITLIKSVKKVNNASLALSNYFLVDLPCLIAAPDLYLTGRTLFWPLLQKKNHN